MYEYMAKILKVVDGDTVHMEVDLGLETYRESSAGSMESTPRDEHEGGAARKRVSSEHPNEPLHRGCSA